MMASARGTAQLQLSFGRELTEISLSAIGQDGLANLDLKRNTFRLKGHGMPTVGKPDERGDAYATVDVQLPRTLTPEQRKLFEELQRLEHAGVNR